MRLIAFLLFMSCCIAVKADANKFPGMVRLNIGQHVSRGPLDNLSAMVSDTVVFRFYKNPKDASPAKTLSFYFGWNLNPRREVIIERDYRTWLAPMIFKDDSTSGYYQVYFTCISRKGYWMEVIVNEQTQEKLWIKEERFVHFHSWTDIADKKKTLTISANGVVYTKRDTTSAPVTVTSNCFRIDKVSGEWMQVSSADPELCGAYDQPKLKQVWVRFRTADSLTITVVAH